MRRAITIIVITIAFLSIASSKAYCTNLISPALPELVLENDTLDNPEQAPEFPGGMKELTKYLTLDIDVNLPQPLCEHGLPGRVIIQFVIDKDGNAIASRINKHLDPILDKEALKAINLMPRWKPGMQNGKPVMTRFTAPVAFRLHYKTK